MSPRCLTLVVICVVFLSTETVSGEDVKKAVGDEVSFHPDKQQEQRLNSTVKGEEVKVFGEVGGRVSFRPTSLNPPVSSIIWRHRNGGYVVKVIEWDVDDGFSIPHPRFRDITTLDEKTGQITITHLNAEHCGLYTIDINSKEQEQRFKLEVLEPVPKPEIKIEKIEMNPNAVYLICEYSETIIWKNSAGETLKGSPQSLKGELIKVEKQGNPDFFYTCTLENAVSEKTSDPVYERDLFKDLRGFVIWIATVSISMVFIILFLFIPPCCHAMRG